MEVKMVGKKTALLMMIGILLPQVPVVQAQFDSVDEQRVERRRDRGDRGGFHGRRFAQDRGDRQRGERRERGVRGPRGERGERGERRFDSRRRGPGGPMGRMDPDERREKIDEILDFVEEHFPARYRELSTLRTTNPSAFRRRFAAAMPKLMEMAERFKRNPEIGQLMIREERIGFQIRRLVDEYIDTDSRDRKDDLRNQIEELVTEQIGVRMELREFEVKRLERRLEVFRKRLDRDRERSDEVIQRTLKDLGVLDD
jgi:hypothetical protein